MFSDSKTILFLKSKSLFVYNTNLKIIKSFTFKEDFVYHQEIINKEEFRHQLESFLSDTKMQNQRVILLLADEVLFKKTFGEISDPNELAEATAKFFNEIPFNPEKLIKKVYRIHNGVMALATNGEFYSVISEVLRKIGWILEAVVPIAVLSGIGGGNALSEEDIKTISINEKMMLKAGLIDQQVQATDKSSDDNPQEQTQDIRQNKRMVLLIGGVVISAMIFLVAFGLSYLGGSEKTPNGIQNTPSDVVNPAVAISPTATTSASPSPSLTLTPTISQEPNLEATPSTQGGSL